MQQIIVKILCITSAVQSSVCSNNRKFVCICSSYNIMNAYYGTGSSVSRLSYIIIRKKSNFDSKLVIKMTLVLAEKKETDFSLHSAKALRKFNPKIQAFKRVLNFTCKEKRKIKSLSSLMLSNNSQVLQFFSLNSSKNKQRNVIQMVLK